ncbi:MAG: hypothetical protein KDA65_17435, partial [Planctomycetaceae bacterium]|nr:hypothetical protein [Planctomycetaceae bacterium]
MLNFTATRKSSRVHFWLFTIGIALLSGCSEEVTNERDRLFSMEAPQRTASHINSEINIQVASDAINRAIELSFIALEKERPNASSQLLRCIELQVVMKDFEGALDTFFKTPQSVFSKGDILDLADAFATSGETETAKVFLALLPPSYTSDDEVLQASVDTSSIRADINAGNLERAAKKTHRLTIPILRQELFCLLAIAFYEQHEEIKTDEYLTAAVDELENLPRNRLRERLIKTAESQIQTNRVKPARKTIQRLIDPNNIYRDLTTYYQTAVLYARSGDHEKANSTFQQAELLRLELSEDNQSQIVNNTFSLSYYQTEAGYFSEARKNAEKLSHDSFEYRNALLKIVEYQLEANTPEEAIQTAESSLSSQHDQDNAWVAIAHYYIKREEWRQ